MLYSPVRRTLINSNPSTNRLLDKTNYVMDRCRDCRLGVSKARKTKGSGVFILPTARFHRPAASSRPGPRGQEKRLPTPLFSPLFSLVSLKRGPWFLVGD